MSSQKRTSKLLSWSFSALLIGVAIWVYFSRQAVVDAISYHQYTPTAEIERISTEARMTDSGKYTFYVTRPSVESSQTFNNNCKRQEADSPILGCYTGSRIHIFDVKDGRLAGIKVVTAAHEMLHAAYDRLPEGEKSRVNALLEEEFKKNSDEDLKQRMEYYDRTEPGQSLNELHSIIGTERSNVSTELEAYYKQYFNDRNALVALHTSVASTFDSLSNEATELTSQINAAAEEINIKTASYNAGIEDLNDSIEQFNQRARADGGFSTQAEFESGRNALAQQSDALGRQRATIESLVSSYKQLVSRLDAINSQSANLNKSIDSTLSDVPTI